jgi:tripartite-type tricarboxylate transporter receptor subunit TctC
MSRTRLNLPTALVTKLVTALAATAILAAAPAHAQQAAPAWPDRSVKVINTFPAGGSGDAVIRVVFDRITTALGQPFVQEVRAGAAGAIGTEFVARAAPDGYTFVMGTASTFGTNSATVKNLSYDPVRDFTPVGMMATTPFMLLVNPSVPAKDVREYVAYLKANPGKLNFGSFGNGSSNHLAYELFRGVTNTDLVHIAYKGGAPLITALLSGEIQSSMDVYATANPHVRAGKFRLLGVASAKRFTLTPDTPTLTEQGFPVEGGTFFAILGPAKLPQPIVTTLNREINRAIQIPEVRERLAALGTEVAGGTPADLADVVQKEVAKWARLVRERNLKFD